MSDQLSVSLQENLLVLLVYKPHAASLIRNSIEVRLFGNPHYREIVQCCYNYIDQYREPPGEHLPDLLEDKIGRNDASAQIYIDILNAIYTQHEQGVNEKYITDQLEKFVRQQTLKTSIASAAEAIQDGDLDRAEAAFSAGLKQRLTVFNPGSLFRDVARLGFSREIRFGIVPCGIKELDMYGLGAARGEYHLFIAPPKKGKTWWLTHVTKQALLARMKVLVITLELSEQQWGGRMAQSLFSITQRKAAVDVTRMHVDDLGRLLHFEHDKITNRLSFDTISDKAKMEKKLSGFHAANNLIIKQFPAGQLTPRMLRGYLDTLEQTMNFIPDCLVIDYPDYMKIDPKNYRLEAADLHNEIRGIAVERNVPIFAASRSNREGAKAKLVTDIHSGEDYSRIFTADTVLTYSQTIQERELGLARIFVGATRVGERDRFVVLISQAYKVGQFCLDSCMLGDSYEGHLETAYTNRPVRSDEGKVEHNGE